MIEDKLFGDIPAYQQLRGIVPSPQGNVESKSADPRQLDALPDDFDKMMETPLTGEEVAMKMSMLAEQGLEVNKDTISKQEFLAYHEWHKNQASNFWGMMGDAAAMAGKELYGGTAAIATDWKKLAAATGLSLAASPLVGIGSVYGQTILEGAARGTRDLVGLGVMAANHPGSPLYRLFINPNENPDQLYQDFLDLSEWNNKTMRYVSGKETMVMPDKAAYEKVLGKEMGDTLYDFVGVNHEIATAASYFLDPTMLLSLGGGKAAAKAGAAAMAAGAPGKGVQAAVAGAATRAGFVSSALSQGSDALAAAGAKVGGSIDRVTASALEKGGSAVQKLGYMVTRPIDVAYGFVQRRLEDVFGNVVNHTAGRYGVRRVKPDTVMGHAPQTLSHAILLAGGGNLLFNVPYGGAIAAAYAAAKGLEIGGKGAKKLGRGMVGGGKTFLQAAADMNAASSRANGGGAATTAAIEAAGTFTEYFKMLAVASAKGSAYGAVLGGLSTGEEGIASGIGAGGVIGSYAHNLGVAYGTVSGAYNKQKMQTSFVNHIKGLREQGLILQADRMMEFFDMQKAEHGEDHAIKLMGQMLATSQGKDTVTSYIRPSDAIEAISNDSTLWVKNDDGSFQVGPDGKPVLNAAGQALFNLAKDTIDGKPTWNGMFIHENPDGTQRQRPWAMWTDSRTGRRHIVINIEGFTYLRDEAGNVLTADKIVPTGRLMAEREANITGETVEGPRPTVDDTTTSTRQDVVDMPAGKSSPDELQRQRLAAARGRVRRGLAWEELPESIQSWNSYDYKTQKLFAEKLGLDIDDATSREFIENAIKENEALIAERNAIDSTEGRGKWFDNLKERFNKAKKLKIKVADALEIKDAEKRIDAIEALEKEYGKDVVSDILTEQARERKPIKSTSTRTVEAQGPGAPVIRYAAEKGAKEGPRPKATAEDTTPRFVKEDVGPESGVELKGKLRKQRLPGPGVPKEVEAQGPGRPIVSERIGTNIGVKKVGKTQLAKDAVLEELFHLYNAVARDQKVRTAVDAVREWLIGTGTSKGMLETQPKNVVELLRKVVEREGLAKTPELKLEYEKLFNEMEQGKIDYDNVNKYDVMFEELGAKMFIGWVDGKPFDYIYRHGDLGLIRNTIEVLKDKFAQQFQREASQLGADIRTEKYLADWFKKHGGKQFKFDKTITNSFKDMMRLYKSEGLKDAGAYEFRYRSLPPVKQVQWAEEQGLEHWIKRDDTGAAIGLKSVQEINQDQHAAMHRGVSELFQEAEVDETVLDGIDFYLVDAGQGNTTFPAANLNTKLDASGQAMLWNSSFDTVASDLANQGKLLYQSPDMGNVGQGISDIQNAQAGQGAAPATGKLKAQTRFGARGRPRTTPTGKMLKEMREMLAKAGPQGTIMVFRGVPNQKAFNILAKHLPKAMSENIRRMSMAVFDGGRSSGNLFSGLYHGFEHVDANGNKHVRADGDVWKPRNVTFVPYEMEFAVNLRNPKTANYDYSRPHMYARVRTLDMDVLGRRMDMLWEQDYEAMQRLYDSKDSFEAHVYKTLTEYSSTDLIPSKEFFGRDDEAWERRQYVMAAIGAFPNRTQNRANEGTIGTIDQPYHRFLSRKDESYNNGYNNPWTTLHLGNMKGLVEEGPSKAKFVFTEKAYYRSMIPTPAGKDMPGQPSRFNVAGTTRPIMYQAEEAIPGMMMNPIEYLDGMGVDVNKYKSEQKLIADAVKHVGDPLKLLKEIKKTPWLNKPKEDLFPKFQAADNYGARGPEDGEFLRGNFEYAHEQLGDIFQSEAVKRFIADKAGPDATIIKMTLEEYLASKHVATGDLIRVFRETSPEDSVCITCKLGQEEAIIEYGSQFETGKPVVVVGNHGTNVIFASSNKIGFDSSKAGAVTKARSAGMAWFHAGSSQRTSVGYSMASNNRMGLGGYGIGLESSFREASARANRDLYQFAKNIKIMSEVVEDLKNKNEKSYDSEAKFNEWTSELKPLEITISKFISAAENSLKNVSQKKSVPANVVETIKQNLKRDLASAKSLLEDIKSFRRKLESRELNKLSSINEIYGKLTGYFDSINKVAEDLRAADLGDTYGSYVRSILAFRNPFVANLYNQQGRIALVERGFIANTVKTAKENGHDGVIFVGIHDGLTHDITYATLIEHTDNILKLETSFKTRVSGPYRRGLNGQEGAGERFQAADIGPEEAEPRRRSARKSEEEIISEIEEEGIVPQIDKIENIDEIGEESWAEKKAIEEGYESAAARELERKTKDGDDYENESQAADIEKRDISGENPYSGITDIKELKKAAKRNDDEIADAVGTKLDKIDDEIDLANESGNTDLAERLDRFRSELEELLPKLENQAEVSKRSEMKKRADEMKATYGEYMQVAELVRGLRAKNEAPAVINFQVNKLLREINKRRPDNKLSFFAIQEAKMKIGNKTFGYLDLTPELIEARYSEIMGSVQETTAKPKQIEKPKDVQVSEEPVEPRVKTVNETPDFVKEQVSKNNLRSLPKEVKEPMLLRRALAEFWEERGWDESFILRMEDKDLQGAKELMDELRQVNDKAFELLHDFELEISTAYLTQETVDALAEKMVHQDENGIVRPTLRELQEVGAEYDLASLKEDGIEGDEINPNVYLDALNGIIPRVSDKRRHKKLKDRPKKSSIMWEHLQTEKFAQDKIIDEVDDDGTVNFVVGDDGKVIGEGDGVTIWDFYRNEAYSQLNDAKNADIPRQIPYDTIVTKNWDNVTTRDDIREAAKNLSPAERYEFFRDYLTKAHLGLIKTEPDITYRTLYRAMTAQDMIVEQKELNAWWEDYMKRINFGIEVYNNAMVNRNMKNRVLKPFADIKNLQDYFYGRVNYSAEVAVERLTRLLDLSENFAEIDPAKIEPLASQRTEIASSSSDVGERGQVGLLESTNNFFVIAMLNKWEENIRNILSNENHPDHNRLTLTLDDLQETGRLSGKTKFFTKNADGKWVFGRLFEEISDVRMEEIRQTGIKQRKGREQTLLTHELLEPFEVISEIMGDAARRDLRFFNLAISASRDSNARERFMAMLPKEIQDWMDKNDDSPMPVLDPEFKRLLETEWAKEIDVDEAEAIKLTTPMEDVAAQVGMSSDEVVAIMGRREQIANEFNGRAHEQIKKGAVPRTAETISDSEIMAEAFRKYKMKFNVYLHEGNEVIAFKGEQPKGSKYVRTIYQNQLTKDLIEKAYNKAFEDNKVLMRNPDRLMLASETNMNEVELALAPKVEKSGANTKMTPVEKQALPKVAGTNRVTNDGTTVDGQYKVDNRPNVGNKPSLKVVQVASEANPHTGQPQPEKVVAIVNTPEEAQAAIIKHEEQVREVVEAVTGEETKNPLDNATKEIPKEVVEQVIEEAKALDNELVPRPLPADEPSAPAPTPVVEAPKPEAPAPVQAPKLPPNLSGAPASSAARQQPVFVLRLDSSRPDHREKWVKGFMAARNAQKFGVAVDPKTPDELKGYRLLMTDNGGAFAYVSPDGEIGGVARAKEGTKADVDAVMKSAIKAGGKWLTAYDTILPDLYTNSGFTAVARVKFDIKYNPDFPTKLFEKFNRGQPDVIAMAFTGTAAPYETVKADLPVVSYDEAIKIAMEKSGMTKQETKPVETKPKPFPPEKHPYFGDAVTLLMATGMDKPLAIRLAKDAIGNNMEKSVEDIVKSALVIKQTLGENVKKQEAKRQERKPVVNTPKQPSKPKTTILPRPPKVEPAAPTQVPAVPVAPAAPQRPVNVPPRATTTPAPATVPTPPPSIPQGMPAPRVVSKAPSKPKKGMTLDEATAIMLTEFDTYKTAYKHGPYTRQGVTYVNGAGYTIQQTGLSKFRVFNPGKVYIGEAPDEQDAVDLIIKEYYGIR
jgi:hypothetical protein